MTRAVAYANIAYMQRSLEVLIVAEVRAEIARQGVTAAAIARSAGMTQSSLSRRLRGLQPLSAGELVLICEALGLQASEMVRRAEAVAA